jgi:RNA-directed DNA polymerase
MTNAILELLGMFMKQQVLEDMRLWTPEKGTPQGAVISPLLANLYLHSVDKAMAEAGHIMVRYADDFVVLCRTRNEAEQAFALVESLVQDKGLMLHPMITRVVDTTQPGEGFDFLGYRFENGTHRLRKKSLDALKESIRQKTGRSNGNSLETIISRVNMMTRGWIAYFKHSN